jgi:hypothetical protein
MGNFFYHNYPGDAGLIREAVFGRIGGRSAAAEALGRQVPGTVVYLKLLEGVGRRFSH